MFKVIFWERFQRKPPILTRIEWFNSRRIERLEIRKDLNQKNPKPRTDENKNFITSVKYD
jgi:hypothetical protein